MLGLLCASAYGAKPDQKVAVVEPFLELRTGPGRAYPIYYIAERGENIVLLSRRTDWVQVRTAGDREGWVSLEQMSQTLQPDGTVTAFNDGSLADYADHRWEAGVMAGDFGGANVISGYGAYSFTPNLALELSLSQLLGNVSDGNITAINITHTFFPRLRLSPFVSLGTGVIVVKPNSTLVQAQDRRDNTAIAGIGAKAYLTKRLIFRAEYKNYYVFTSRDTNEDVYEWKLGFSIFY
jgi:hypothetical protein